MKIEELGEKYVHPFRDQLIYTVGSMGDCNSDKLSEHELIGSDLRALKNFHFLATLANKLRSTLSNGSRPLPLEEGY